MRTITIQINDENDAFKGDGNDHSYATALESARALREIADRVEDLGLRPADHFTVSDANGAPSTTVQIY